MVELPTGRIAAPGLVDWTAVRLTAAGEEIPFLLREGRAHWRARLAAPGAKPKAEDLLVFWCAVPPGEWVHVSVVSATPVRAAALSPTDGALVISRGDVEARIDAETGLLTALTVQGESLLRAGKKDSSMPAMSRAERSKRNDSTSKQPRLAALVTSVTGEERLVSFMAT